MKYSGKDLELGLANAGDLALVGQLAEADTADAVVTKIGVGAAADLAAVVAAGGELESLLLENHRFLSHFRYPPHLAFKGSADHGSAARGPLRRSERWCR